MAFDSYRCASIGNSLRKSAFQMSAEVGCQLGYAKGGGGLCAPAVSLAMYLKRPSPLPQLQERRKSVRTGSASSNLLRVFGVQLSRTGLMRSYRQPSPRLWISTGTEVLGSEEDIHIGRTYSRRVHRRLRGRGQGVALAAFLGASSPR